MASNDHKSAAELEREVEMQRHRLSDTIDEIQDRLSPGQIVDQLMSYSKGGAGEFAQNMSRSVMQNPLPAALLGVSLFWLMTGRNPMSSVPGLGSKHDGAQRRSNATNEHPAYYDEAGYQDADYGYDESQGGGIGSKLKGAAGKIGGAAGKIGDAVAGVGEKISGVASGAGSAMGHARNAMHDARDGVSGARHAVGDGLGQARERLSGVGSTLSHRAHDLRDQASMLQGNAMSFFTEQPLVAGALAFAAGAALGATLPVTRKEHELLGETSDEVKSRLKDAAQPLMSQAKDVLGDVMEEGKTVLKDTLEDGKAALGNAQNRLGESFGHVKDTVSGSVSSAMGSSSDQQSMGSDQTLDPLLDDEQDTSTQGSGLGTSGSSTSPGRTVY